MVQDIAAEKEWNGMWKELMEGLMDKFGGSHKIRVTFLVFSFYTHLLRQFGGKMALKCS